MKKDDVELLDQPVGSLRRDGKRNFVHPADVKGKFTRLRYVIFAALIVVYVSLPFIQVGGKPAVFLDVPGRKFYLFGGTFNAQDFWLVFFIMTGVGFALIVVTTLLGRVWCGYACPQTVFLEGVYRRVERLIEGPRNQRLRRNQGVWKFDKIWRKVLKQSIFIAISILLSHFFLSYFVSLPSLAQMVQDSPARHPEAFTWMAVMSILLYLNFGFFREQLCLIVCPYGRLQSAMLDTHTIIIGYDEKRGEPRGKSTDASTGDCIDCGRCKAVCPTGIDIRNGLQLECVGCAACIDACDDIMVKIDRPKGLIRYDSMRGFQGKARQFIRPRLFLYAALGAIGLTVAGFVFSNRQSFEATLLRASDTPYTLSEGQIRNVYQIRLHNKKPNTETFVIEPILRTHGQIPFDFQIPIKEIQIESLSSRTLPVVVSLPAEKIDPELFIQIRVKANEKKKLLKAPFLGPKN